MSSNIYDLSVFDLNNNMVLETHELVNFYSKKILAITSIGLIYFFIGSLISFYFTKYIIFINYNNDPKKNTIKQDLVIILSLIYEICILLILVFIVRKLVKTNIGPLNNMIDGIDLKRIKEINGNIILATSFMMFSRNHIVKKVEYIINLFNL